MFSKFKLVTLIRVFWHILDLKQTLGQVNKSVISYSKMHFQCSEMIFVSFCENCRTIVLPCNCVSFCSYSFFFNFGSGTTTCLIKILMEFSYYISRTASKVHKSLGLSGMTNCAHIFLLKNRHHQDTMIRAKAWDWIMWKIVCKFQIVPVPISTWRRTNR